MTWALEDVAVGQIYELGSHTVTDAEIRGFAATWDPQPFHLDSQATGPYRGLIASGWHTAAIFMRRYVDTLLIDSTCLGSPGVDELRWHAPVRPGDTLTAQLTVEAVTRSTRRPDRGTVRPRCVLTNQHGTRVFEMVLITLLAIRTEPAPAPPRPGGQPGRPTDPPR